MGVLQHINLKDLRFFSYHGVYPEEQILGNEYFVTILTTFEIEDYDSLELKNTVNYEEVYAIVKHHMDFPQQLLEPVAFHIMESIRNVYPFLKEIQVNIRKNNPPFGGDIAKAEVNIHWTSEEKNEF